MSEPYDTLRELLENYALWEILQALADIRREQS